MAKMKTEFKLEYTSKTHCGWIRIVPNNDRPYVVILTTGKEAMLIPDKSLECFAVNILKALKSKKLNSK